MHRQQHRATLGFIKICELQLVSVHDISAGLITQNTWVSFYSWVIFRP